MRHLRGVINTLGQSKISNLQVKFMIHHNITGIKIPMNNLLLIVHIPQDGQQTNQQFPNDRLLEVLAFLALVADQLGEVGALDDLHHDEEVVLFDEGFVEFYYVGVF
jgi:hypothetical protein